MFTLHWSKGGVSWSSFFQGSLRIELCLAAVWIPLQRDGIVLKRKTAMQVDCVDHSAEWRWTGKAQRRGVVCWHVESGPLASLDIGRSMKQHRCGDIAAGRTKPHHVCFRAKVRGLWSECLTICMKTWGQFWPQTHRESMQPSCSICKLSIWCDSKCKPSPFIDFLSQKLLAAQRHLIKKLLWSVERQWCWRFTLLHGDGDELWASVVRTGVFGPSLRDSTHSSWDLRLRARGRLSKCGL